MPPVFSSSARLVPRVLLPLSVGTDRWSPVTRFSVPYRRRCTLFTFADWLCFFPANLPFAVLIHHYIKHKCRTNCDAGQLRRKAYNRAKAHCTFMSIGCRTRSGRTCQLAATTAKALGVTLSLAAALLFADQGAAYAAALDECRLGGFRAIP